MSRGCGTHGDAVQGPLVVDGGVSCPVVAREKRQAGPGHGRRGDDGERNAIAGELNGGRRRPRGCDGGGVDFEIFGHYRNTL